MTACSLSEVLAEGVECDRWVWWVSSLACIVVVCGICCLVGFYWDAVCLFLRRRCLKSFEGLVVLPLPRLPFTRAAKGRAPDGDSPPAVLCVDSPMQHRECSGNYDIIPQRVVNGQPIWQKRGAERWLYSGFDGRWYICGPATKERNFDCASGYIYNSSFHKGALPHHLGSSWEWSGGLQWHRDATIVVCLPGPAGGPPRRHSRTTAAATSQASDIFVVGPHKSSVGQGLKSMPISENQEYTGSDVTDYEGRLNPTVVGARNKDTEAMQPEDCKQSKAWSMNWGSFQGVLDKLGVVRRDPLSDDSTQDENSQDRDVGDTSTEHSAGSCSGSPRTSGMHRENSDKTSDLSSNSSSHRCKDPPQLLCVISPNGQRECAGTYEFVSGETANGCPLWKQQDCDRWLYSSTTKRWCIGGLDVKEDNFQRTAGYISQTAPHKSTMPDRTSSLWQRWDGEKFEKDASICIVHLHQPRNKTPDLVRPNGEKLDMRGKRANVSMIKKIQQEDVMAVVV